MKKYTWDIPSLKQEKKELLKTTINRNLSNEERNILNLDIENLEDMLDNSFISRHIPYLPYLFEGKKTLEKHILELFGDFISQFQIQTIKNTSDYFLNCKSNSLDDSIFNTNITLENQIELIKKYFSFNNILKKDNIELFNPNSRRLHIHNNKLKNTFYYANKKGYIYNYNKEALDDFTSLCHELGHNHEFILTNNRIDIRYHIYEENYFLLYREIYSIFYELVSSYILQKEKIITLEERYIFQKNVFDMNTENLDKLIISYLISKEQDMTLRELLMFKSLSLPIENIAFYYYSYLIAVNLFEQFLIDEEKALYNLNYLISNVTPENEEKVLKFIDATPNDLTKIIKHTNPFLKKRNN